MRRKRQGGFTLVQALVVVAGLVALMAALAAEQRVALNATQDRLRQRRAEVAARSALAVAAATLEEADPHLVTLNDDWALLGEGGTQVTEIGGSTYRLQILDAGSLVNVNTTTEIQLQSLPLTQEQIDGLLDWREDSTQGRPQGAKDDYYNTLDQPYNARLGPLTTLSELLLIKGWTARGLYSPLTETVSTARVPADAEGNPLPLVDVLTVQSGMPNTRFDGSTRINIARGITNEAALSRLGLPEAITEQIVRGGPYTSWSDLLSLPGLTPDNAGSLLDEFTFTAGNRLEGKININTVPEALLESLFTLPPDIASTIVSRQAAGFGSLGELATVPGMTPSQLAQIADFVGVGSDTWIVRTYGESGGVGVALEAVIGRRGDRTRILSFDRLSGSRVPEWWNWADASTETTAGLEVAP
ncbi:MAG: helix-hairpin-helix domain-containing protein [Armatimonadota bacterium]